MSFIKLPFSILAVSGYEENFPPEGLTTHSRGWHSERFCIFPQTIILAFDFGKCRIKKIQLLIHEFKIPRKVEFFAGTVDSDEAVDQPNIDFKRIGFIDLNDNSHNCYKSRELKSIHVDFEATHLKISLYKNYINAFNLYNQVGLVAINLLGEVMDSDYLVRTMSERNGLHYGLANAHNKDSLVKGFINQDAIDKRIPFLHDLSFDFHQDAKMIKFISAVSEAKVEAVKLENFGVAKALKTVLNNAKRASVKIVKLQIEKEQYIENEDYDEAQRCKTQVEEIKLSLIEELESYGLLIDQNGVIYSSSIDQKDSGLELANSNSSSKNCSLDSISNSTSPAVVTSTKGSPVVIRVQSPSLKQNGEVTHIVNQEPIRAKSPPALEVKTVPSKQENHDVNLLPPQHQNNRIVTRSGSPLLPAQQKLLVESTLDKNIEVDLQKPQSPSESKVLTRTGSPMLPGQQKLLESREKDIEKPESPLELKSKSLITRTGSPMLPAQQKLLSKQGNNPEEGTKSVEDKINETARVQMVNAKNVPKDLIEPEPLSAIQLEQFAACIDVFQLFVVQHTLSINFKCREYGLAEISHKIIEWKKIGKGSDISLSLLCKATMQLAGYCLEDSREKSSLLTLGVLSQLLEVAREDGDDSQIFNSFINHIDLLIAKAGDTNPRIKSTALDILKKLLKVYHQPPNSLLPELLKPFKDKKKGAVIHPKILKSRLEILSFVVSEYRPSQQDHRFSSAAIMTFIKPFIDNTNNDVRDLAYSIAARICIDEGESFTSEYINSIRDAQKEILSKKIASLGGAKSERKPSTKSAKSKDKPALKKPLDNNKELESKQTIKKSALKKQIDHNEEHESKKTESVCKKSTNKEEDEPSKTQKSKKTIFSADAGPENQTKKSSKKSKSESSDETCLFCETPIKVTGDDSLEKHYAQECPYLVECPQCGLVVEITLLQTHMYGSCEQAPSDLKSCDRCHLLISSVDYISHRSKKKCKIWNIDHDPSICGICKKSIMGKSGWKVHIKDKKCISKRHSKKRK